MIFTNRNRHPIRSLGTVMIKGGKKEQGLNVAFRILGGMKAKKLMAYTDTSAKLMANISPVLSVRPYKKSGYTIRVPFKVYPGYENYLGLQMMRINARRRHEYHAFQRYYLEAVESFSGTSTTARQVDRLHFEAMNSRKFLKRIRRR